MNFSISVLELTNYAGKYLVFGDSTHSKRRSMLAETRALFNVFGKRKPWKVSNRMCIDAVAGSIRIVRLVSIFIGISTK